MLLEICASSFQSALAAERAGAARIELCCELGLGGITPSHGLIEKVCKTLTIPVHVLIRPRSGDFTYSSEELEVMLSDIAFAKAQGAAGIVSGVLDPHFNIHRENTALLIGASQGLKFCFHRAFDWTPHPLESLNTLLELGVDSVLSSGQQPTAIAGISCLKACLDYVDNKMTIMPGGGITPEMIKEFKAAGFLEIHTSASRSFQGVTHPLPMSNLHQLQKGLRSESDPDLIREYLKALE